MPQVIYKDEDGNIRAFKSIKNDDFTNFFNSLSEDQIIFKDGKVNEENIPDKDKEVFPAILKSFMKQWAMNQSVLEPAKREPKRKVVQEEGVDLVVEDTPKPKKRGRKKKA